MIRGATWIQIDLHHQFRNRKNPVANHMCGLSPAGSHELFSHHEQSVIIPFRKLLDYHRIALSERSFKGSVDLFTREKVERNSTALIAIPRLDHYGHTNLLGRCPGIVRAGHRPTFGHRQTHLIQNDASQILVLHDVLGNGAGAAGCSG